jgi:hypothetical protein
MSEDQFFLVFSFLSFAYIFHLTTAPCRFFHVSEDLFFWSSPFYIFYLIFTFISHQWHFIIIQRLVPSHLTNTGSERLPPYKLTPLDLPSLRPCLLFTLAKEPFSCFVEVLVSDVVMILVGFCQSLNLVLMFYFSYLYYSF